MNNDQIKGKWKQIEGEAKKRWAKLTGDDWKMAEGSLENLAGRIQERYGESKERALELLDNIVSRIPSGGNATAVSVPEQELAASAPSGFTWNESQIKGKWKQIEGEAKRAWAKLTDDDWKLIGGDIEKLVGKIQERYGDAKEVVTAQLQQLVGKFQETTKRFVDAARKTQEEPHKPQDGPVRGPRT